MGIGAALHLVHPLGFSTDDKAVRRAGLDYWSEVDVTEHENHEAFWKWVGFRRFHLFSTRGQSSHTKIKYQRGDILVFGSETKGLPRDWIDEHGAARIPMKNVMRSLNLSNSVAVVSYTALEQLVPEWF